jgi:tetratricopeptide (TPR) repeat protein
MSKNITSVNQEKDALFVLIKSLSKSEKRQFNLYVGRLGGNIDAKFFSLFKFLEKQKTYNEKVILTNNIVSKQQLSNLKAHLYKQILISLRLNPAHKNIRIQIREQLDFATVLYQKGLYKQSLKLLDKAKNLALENEEKNVAYEIVELEKVIETQYITRSISTRADVLSVQAKTLSQLNVINSKLSNLSLQLYSHLLQNGYVKNNEELEFITKYFNDKLPKYVYTNLGFREKLFLYKSHLWFSFLTQDFLQSYKYASKWVDLFKNNRKLISLHPVFYLKGKNYLLEASFLVKNRNRFKEELELFEEEIEHGDIPSNTNSELLIFQYYYTNKLHSHFLNGNFSEGEYLVDIINEKIQVHINRLDKHYVVMLYYKIACLYFGMGKNELCIEYLQKIIKSKHQGSAEDLQCFARILNLIAHYECGLDYDLERQFIDTYKFLLKMENLQEVQKEFITSIKALSDVFPHEIKKEFKKIHTRLQKFESHPYEKRAFLYLDILSWLESKIQNKPIATIIKEKINIS